MDSADVPHAPLHGHAELFAQPQAEARGYRVTVRDPQGRPVDLVGSPFRIAGDDDPRTAAYPPGIGQDTDAVLAELCGLRDEELRALREEGVTAYSQGTDVGPADRMPGGAEA